MGSTRLSFPTVRGEGMSVPGTSQASNLTLQLPPIKHAAALACRNCGPLGLTSLRQLLCFLRTKYNPYLRSTVEFTIGIAFSVFHSMLAIAASPELHRRSTDRPHRVCSGINTSTYHPAKNMKSWFFKCLMLLP